MADEKHLHDHDENAAAGAAKAEAKPKSQQRILLVSYPKMVFLYPTLIAALVGGFYMLATKVEQPVVQVTDDGAAADGAAAQPDAPVELRRSGAHTMARAFLLVAIVNLVVIAFDFPRTTSLTLFFFAVAAGVLLWMLFRLKPDLAPAVTEFINSIHAYANATFYFLIAAGLIILYIGVFISRKFDYWEVRPNELLHHHGFLSDLERFAAPNLRIDKEINDVFEYLLLRSGRLILHPNNEPRAIVLENVFFINKKESQITRMLGALQVQVRDHKH